MPKAVTLHRSSHCLVLWLYRHPPSKATSRARSMKGYSSSTLNPSLNWACLKNFQLEKVEPIEQDFFTKKFVKNLRLIRANFFSRKFENLDQNPGPEIFLNLAPKKRRRFRKKWRGLDFIQAQKILLVGIKFYVVVKNFICVEIFSVM